ncbi:hypothetical protein EYC84_003006 [Monilinia fructicola]|uniref:DH domain-containing protein n=1 Tax=Monilinia fructicola TaxID=38448 RepID=A0A5M9JSC3_MONFR|nr:hypothetical protein EYC84_003006 [Monilinia fructicola]
MSFHANGGRRYGHIPPAQYGAPTGQPSNHSGPGLHRQSSFDNGDDAAFFDPSNSGYQPAPPSSGRASIPSEEIYTGNNSMSPQSPGRSSFGAPGSPALSGYQHQYQPLNGPQSPSQPTYNPQNFARSQSHSQASQYRPHPSYNPSISSQNQYSNSASSNHQPYNPAAYQPSQYPTRASSTASAYNNYNSAYAQASTTASASYWSPNSQQYGSSSPPARASAIYESYMDSPPLRSPSYAPHPAPLPLPPRQASYNNQPLSTAPYPVNGDDFAEDGYRSNTQMPTYPNFPGGVLRENSTDSLPQDLPPIPPPKRSSTNSSNAPAIPMSASPGSALQRHPTQRPLPSAPMEQNMGDEDDWGLGIQASTLHTEGTSYDDYEDDESDLEAAAGLEAMRIADEQDSHGIGPGGLSFGGPYEGHLSYYEGQSSHQDGMPHEESSDSDYKNMDLGLVGGGYDAHMSYGDDLTGMSTEHSSEMEDQSRPLPTPHQLSRSDSRAQRGGLGGMADYSMPGEGELHPFPAFDEARIDNYGTGGLERPTSHAHRLSFDEGDEHSIQSRLLDSRQSGRSGSDSPTRDEMPDMFYHPGMTPASYQRPLPAVPPMSENMTPQLQPAGSYRNSHGYSHSHSSSFDSARPYPPSGPDAYPQSALQPALHPWQRLTYPLCQPVAARNFHLEELSTADFRRCAEPWALSGIAAWIREMAGGETGEGESDLRVKLIEDGLIALFTHMVPTMNTADAETLSERVVKSMFDAGILVNDEEWVKFGQGEVSGVIMAIDGISSNLGAIQEIRGLDNVFQNNQGNAGGLQAKEQGPWVTGFSDIFREWIRKAKSAYIEYAAGFPYATYLVRREADRNLLFRQFLDQARDNKLSGRLDWNTYLKAPITRLQRYGLLLGTVLKNMTKDSDEKTQLAIAIEEIKAVTLECDAKVEEQTRKVDMIELQSKLYLRPGMERVELNLDHLGRELLHRGDLQRAGNNRFTWLETHAILFDHYFVLAKSVIQRDINGARKKEVYDVSKLPIPMQLLVLESSDDDPVQKSAVKGIGAVTTTVTKTAPANAAEARLNRTTTNNTGLERMQTLEQTSTINSTSTATSMLRPNAPNLNDNDAKVMYPFRIKHLGKAEVYTLYAPSASSRDKWCDKIIEAKTRYAAALFAQNAEPFRLRVIADSAFAYDNSMIYQQRALIPIYGTPLDRSVRDLEHLYGSKPRPPPVCRAQVNCAVSFTSYGKLLIAIGTDYGVYISEASNARGWSRVIQMPKVTQIAVLEEFSLCLIIADKALIAYHLDVITPASNFPGATSTESARKAPQKLSGNRDVSFFATARMKERTLVFYKNKQSLNSTFKVLEPVVQKSSEKKARIFGKRFGGTTEFFREFDEFYIPTECFTINLFQSYIAISTQKGFELLTLDKKVPMSIQIPKTKT